MTSPPRLAPDHPDYVLECEKAMDFTFYEVGYLAEAAGWTPDAVDAAMLNLAKNRPKARKTHEMADAAVKLFSPDP
ncbi:hypothetical protein LA66_20470 [Aureimonas altamirensis]|uniref:Uncharacterized protein n=1 Tax=Aureimonas altamirensis TaxID=370622 RepID=A0A0B1PWR3_9HYPH|nr:hypothetical protein [Aureimonas altamirensis]KHJ52998.1 hypothetical protein LA66_20470 [Aureimonas altamirensis]